MDVHRLLDGVLHWILTQSLLRIELEKLAADSAWAVAMQVAALQDKAVWNAIAQSKYVPTQHPALTRYLNDTALEPTNATHGG